MIVLGNMVKPAPAAEKTVFGMIAAGMSIVFAVIYVVSFFQDHHPSPIYLGMGAAVAIMVAVRWYRTYRMPPEKPVKEDERDGIGDGQ